MRDYSTVRWGILGAGNIANRLAEGVNFLPDAELAAVGSRDLEKANAFADKHQIPRRYGSYEELVNDPDLDVIYVATTHNFHREHSLLALNAGKHVLCEKPFTINAGEAEEIVAAAQAKNLFVMEAMWTRFFPLMYRVRDLLREGAIGTPWLVQSDFGFKATFNPSSRLFDPNLGGGALLDVGVYTLSFASMVLGEPSKISGVATLGQSGVDEVVGITLGYPSGAVADLYTTVRANTPHEATILGDKGRIRIERSWWRPDHLTISHDSEGEEGVHMPWDSSGFNYQAAEVCRCLREGKIESDVMPHAESISIMRTMDELRSQWGLKYPGEG